MHVSDVDTGKFTAQPTEKADRLGTLHRPMPGSGSNVVSFVLHVNLPLFSFKGSCKPVLRNRQSRSRDQDDLSDYLSFSLPIQLIEDI